MTGATVLSRPSRRSGVLWLTAALWLAAALWASAGVAWAGENLDRPAPVRGSIADRSAEWPTGAEVRRVALLEDYNVRVVTLGTTLLGAAAGLVGSFTLLRKRALVGDAISHATLPGLAAAFLVAEALGANGKSLGALHVGAAVSGLLGAAAMLALVRTTRLKEDAALCATLSVFFGAGVSLLGVVQQMPAGHSAGLESFIYGKTASMGRADVQFIAGAAAVCGAICLALFKELKLLCFDDGFAGSRGFPTLALDATLMATVVAVTIVGQQAVGLILVVALLITPAAAARFWTDRLGPMAAASAGIGAVGCYLGAGASALFSKLPSGPMIVLACAAIFGLSLVCGSSRGLLVRARRRALLNRAVDRQRLLLALFQPHLPEPEGEGEERLAGRLADRLGWSRGRLRRAVRRAADLVEAAPAGVNDRGAGGGLRLTGDGTAEAARLVRQRRLWELYLETHPEAASGRVDRVAAVEDVLEPDVVADLTALLDGPAGSPAPSPAGSPAGPPRGAAR